MADPLQFIQEVRQEAGKVTWPTRRETLITTGLVITMVILASLFFSPSMKFCNWLSASS